MSTLRIALVAAALAALGATRAAAGTVSSASLSTPEGGYVRCAVVNTGATARIVSTEVLDDVGAVVVNIDDFTYPPGYSGFITGIDGSWCRFRFKGGRGGLRFTAESLDAAFNPLAAIEAR